MESVDQRLVVGEHVEAPPLQQEPEVAQCGHHRQQLPVEGAVSGLRVGELPAEEGEWLPIAAVGSLLQGRSHVVVARIYSQGQLCLLVGMGQMCGLPEGRFGGGEGHRHLLGPHQLAVLAACPTCGVCERLEDAGCPPEVPPVEVEHA